jgi:hypothetical protein
LSPSQYAEFIEIEKGGCLRRNGAAMQCLLNAEGVARFGVRSFRTPTGADPVTVSVRDRTDIRAAVRIVGSLRGASVTLRGLPARLGGELITPTSATADTPNRGYLACSAQPRPPSCELRTRGRRFRVGLQRNGIPLTVGSRKTYMHLQVSGNSNGTTTRAWLASAPQKEGQTVSQACTEAEPRDVLAVEVPTGSSEAGELLLCSNAAGGRYRVTGRLEQAGPSVDDSWTAVSAAESEIEIEAQPAAVFYQAAPLMGDGRQYSLRLQTFDCESNPLVQQVINLLPVDERAGLRVSSTDFHADGSINAVVSVPDGPMPHWLWADIVGRERCMLPLPMVTSAGGTL